MVRIARASLEARLCGLIVCVLIVVLLGVGHFAVSAQKHAMTEQNKDGFDAITKSLALNVDDLVVRDGEADASHKVSIDHIIDLEYIVVADSAGRTVLAVSKKAPKETVRPGMYLWQTIRKITGYEEIDGDRIHKVSVPAKMSDGSGGTLTAGFRTDRLKSTINGMEARIIFGLCVALLFGLLSALAIGKDITHSLKMLIKSAYDVSAGNFNHRLKKKSDDEIGKLTDAFNFMQESILRAQEQLVERANTDSLTGLYNHRYFQERLVDEISRADRYKRALSLIMIDIDHFKNFNDTHGHPVGDMALKEVARILKDTIRDSDVGVRYGGEEFAVILPESTANEAAQTANRLCESISAHKFCGKDGECVKMTLSVGVATYPVQANNSSNLVLAADVALYHAKSSGRNRVSIYDAETPSMPEADPYKLYVLLHANDLPTIEALAEAVDAKLNLPAGHSRMVADLSSKVASQMNLDDAECASIYLAALLRDIGQIAVPNSVLSKAARLTRKEKSIVETHPTLGHSMLQKTSHLTSMLPAVLHHHERYDGSGYPSKLIGDEIPLAARIIAVADAYRSMIIARPHRDAMSDEQARADIMKESGAQFDPDVVYALQKVLSDQDQAERAA